MARDVLETFEAQVEFEEYDDRERDDEGELTGRRLLRIKQHFATAAYGDDEVLVSQSFEGGDLFITFRKRLYYVRLSVLLTSMLDAVLASEGEGDEE